MLQVINKYGSVKSVVTSVVTGETDPLWTAWLSGPPNISLFTNDSGYITSYDNIYNSDDVLTGDRIVGGAGNNLTFNNIKDLVFTTSINDITLNSAKSIGLNLVSDLKINTNAGTSGQVLLSQGASAPPIWGTISYTETDPVFIASPANGIASGDITNWNTAYGWGDHSLAGYLTSITNITGNSGTATTLQTARKINNVSFDGSIDISVDTYLLAIQAMGSTIKAQNIDGKLADASGAISVATGRVYFVAVYLPVATTITGFKWKQYVTGNYTANNYNGGGLYTYSGGTLTLVASSTNDGDIWKATVNTIGNKAFSSTYSAAAGLYFVAVTYSASSAVTPPSLGSLVPSSSVNIVNDFTNSAKSSGFISSLTALPSPTQAMSGITATGGEIWIGLY